LLLIASGPKDYYNHYIKSKSRERMSFGNWPCLKESQSGKKPVPSPSRRRNKNSSKISVGFRKRKF
jgi:hypothetical protein